MRKNAQRPNVLRFNSNLKIIYEFNWIFSWLFFCFSISHPDKLSQSKKCELPRILCNVPFGTTKRFNGDVNNSRLNEHRNPIIWTPPVSHLIKKIITFVIKYWTIKSFSNWNFWLMPSSIEFIARNQSSSVSNSNIINIAINSIKFNMLSTQ